MCQQQCLPTTLLSCCWAYVGRTELLLLYEGVLLEATVTAVVVKLSASCNTVRPICYCKLTDHMPAPQQQVRAKHNEWTETSWQQHD